jgi:vancomycin resistance protein YoaR
MIVKSFDKLRLDSEVSRTVKSWLRRLGFFAVGTLIGLLILVAGFFITFEINYQPKVYPGVKIADLSFGGQTPQQVEDYFTAQNDQFKNLRFAFVYEEKIATLSGEKLKVGYDSKLLADQAYLIGRTGNTLAALYQKFAKSNLSPSFRFDNKELEGFLEDLAQQIDIPAQEALFQFSGGRVTAFKPSAVGQALDRERAKADFAKLLFPPTSGTISLSVVSVEPKVKTEEVNNLGIRQLLGEGKSFFRGSIPARVHNISLASSRLNGILIAPGEVFSFNNALGEVSANTGYKQAYVIKEKRTILDDGGGVCQVSTTFFRAALAAGLAIEERQAHAYRVSYYEQGGFGPGLDATVYAPRVDLKVKNDTPAHILIQTRVDAKNAILTFEFYGTADGRKATIGKPRVWDQVPPPPDLYQDDPNLPKGQNRQIDFPAWGAKTAFDYKVTRNGEVLQNRTFNSNFQPWQAIFLRGTKE